MKLFLIFFLMSITASMEICYSQVTEAEKKLRIVKKDTVFGWYKGSIANINFSQTGLTNWVSGGQNSFAGNCLINLYANLSQNKIDWNNSVDIGYGMLRQGKENIRKTDDKIDFLSKYGKEAFNNWYFAGLLNIKTQMFPGYNYPNDTVVISRFFAPAYFVTAIGMDFKPSKDFNIFIAPATGKFTFVNDEELSNAGAFGVEKGKTTRYETGGYLRLLYKKEIIENITFQNKLDLFSNYLVKPQNIDINWEMLVSLKISKYVAATFATHLIYDDDIKIEIDSTGDGIIDTYGPRTQFKRVLAIGLSYKFDKIPEIKEQQTETN